jgi:murein DD-endopeptidase MepM/ murein hydrolase activator NlpD
MPRVLPAAVIILVISGLLRGAEVLPQRDWPFATVDLNVGQSTSVELANGKRVTVELLGLKEIRDDVREAVREAQVSVRINGRKATLTSANYRLPIVVGDVQVDCSVARGCVQPGKNPWALVKDARLRLWPSGAPWIQTGTFVYPLRQRWFASATQMANEPVFVDGGDVPDKKRPVYYHWGLDAGGAEGLVEVVAATEGVVVTAGQQTLPQSEFPAELKPRYDVVYLRDGRGWYYRYSHLYCFDPALKPGVRVKMGQKIGRLGKEGASGGWSHLHFDITVLQPNGEYGITDAYAFYWQAYHEQYPGGPQAVARPHHLAWTDEPVTLDGIRSLRAQGYQWSFSDGTKAAGATAVQRYSRSGMYSEILKVTDAEGRVDYDFAVVQVIDRQHPEQLPPSIHAAYWPTFGLRAGAEVTFKVRTFRIAAHQGRERWDFGDGSPAVEVQSDGNAVPSAKNGYAVTTHRYAKAGHYLVSVTRRNDRGQSATARLHVEVE